MHMNPLAKFISLSWASCKLSTHAQSCEDSSGLVSCDQFLLLRSVETSCQQTYDHYLIWSSCSQPCFGDSGSEGIITLYACLHEIPAGGRVLTLFPEFVNLQSFYSCWKLLRLEWFSKLWWNFAVKQCGGIRTDMWARGRHVSRVFNT